MVNHSIKISVLGMLLLGMFGSVNCTSGGSQVTMTAEEIQDKSKEVYATCTAYSDTGTMKNKIYTEETRIETKATFQTHFIRPDLFHLQYKEKPFYSSEDSYYIILKKGDEVTTWWDVDGAKETKSSLHMALGGATGVTNSVANTIPGLLELSWGTGILNMVMDDEVEVITIDTEECYVLKGKQIWNTYAIAISKETFLIHRIDVEANFNKSTMDDIMKDAMEVLPENKKMEEVLSIGDMRSVTVTTYKPTVNAPIDKKVFTLDKQ